MDVGVGSLHQTLVRTRTTQISVSPDDSTPIKTRLPPWTPARSTRHNLTYSYVPYHTFHVPHTPISHRGSATNKPLTNPTQRETIIVPSPPPRDHLIPHLHTHSLTPHPLVYPFLKKNPTKSQNIILLPLSHNPPVLNVPPLYQPQTISLPITHTMIMQPRQAQ